MNRAQRRAAQHARPKTDRNELTPARATAWAHTIERVRPYDPDDMVPEFVRIRSAFERLRTGHGTEPDFDLASMALNMALVRAEAIDPALVLIIVQGQQAFARMKARWLRGLPFGFDAQGLQDVPAALDAFEAITTASSPAQMAHSIRETYRRIRAQQIL